LWWKRPLDQSAYACFRIKEVTPAVTTVFIQHGKWEAWLGLAYR
jgi:hypothetical protein